MIFRPFHKFSSGCARYVIGCGGEGVCAVIDPREDYTDDYISFAESKGMKIALVLETHIHADHRSGAAALARRAGAEHALHESAEVSSVLTGDTVFVGSVGRPNLPGETEKCAAQLFESVHKLLQLPGDVEFYPAHFSGSASGAGVSGKPPSTIAFEKRFNPMLAQTRSEFVAAFAALPEKPAGMQDHVVFNRGSQRANG